MPRTKTDFDRYTETLRRLHWARAAERQLSIGAPALAPFDPAGSWVLNPYGTLVTVSPIITSFTPALPSRGTTQCRSRSRT
jgi:hypothetical protein